MVFGKTIDHRLAWLAGIIDGEGWIHVGITNSRTGRFIAYRVRVSNTDPAMMNEIMSILDVIGVRYSHGAVKQRSVLPHHKPQTYIDIAGMTRVSAILEHLLPYLVTKRERALLTLRLIKHRRSHIGKHKGYSGHMRLADDPLAQTLITEVGRLNRRGLPFPAQEE